MIWVLGLRAQKGGAVAVGIGADGALCHNGLIATHDPARPESLAPYAAAVALPETAAVALLAETGAVQLALARAGLAALVAHLGPPQAVALIANRATWVTDLLGHARGWADHVPVVEALAVRAAVQVAVRDLGLPLIEPDEKQLAERLADTARLARLGQGQRPWARVQKLAALAALSAGPAPR